MDQKSLHAVFADPSREFGVMPFWFWNDDLEEGELLRQIREFYDKGFGGFIPHARIGLSRRVGYLTEEYFRLLRIAIDEAARLGMKVVLYDEGSYPSGSAQGRVVAENPSYAARCLIALNYKITGPAKGYWRPNPGRAMQDKMVAVVSGRETAPDALDPSSLELLPPANHGLVRYDVPEGSWRLVACWDVYSGGTIRGVFDEEDDRHAQAPPAGDIMNPEAVACFLRHTHDRYYAHLQDHFGTTIVGMFTDEPGPMGRGPQRGPDPKPFTSGLLDDLQALWDEDVRKWLPALWLDCGPRTPEFRQAYDRAVHHRIEKVFYAAQSNWCRDHGIALTGHPEKSNEMGALRYFRWPGQDMVWRWVAPGLPSALEGPHSVAPKAASSAAALRGCRRTASEALGAYGWRLTLDEAKWLLDWHLARGNNLFFLHACFYSIRGRRAFESEPDLGVHNIWWPYFRILGDYVRRLCWLLTDGIEVCEVAVLTDPNHMSWLAAGEMMKHQIDFLYIDDVSLEQVRIAGNRLVIGTQSFRAVVCDPQNALSPAVRDRLKAFQAAGGLALEEWDAASLIDRLDASLDRDLYWPDAPDLRAIHYRKEGRDFYFLVNEGEETLEGNLSLPGGGSLELWNPLDGSIRPWPGLPAGGRTRTTLRLERRQGLMLAVDPAGTAQPDIEIPPVPGEVIEKIAGPWKALDASGQPAEVPCPGDWAKVREWELFSGTLRFLAEFELPDLQKGQALYLDLGSVGDIAEVFINGHPAGVRAWSPYIFEIGSACRPGVNTLEVRVTNSMANAYDGLRMPSGLMGPVVLRSARLR